MNNGFIPNCQKANQLSLFYYPETKRGRKVGQTVSQYITKEAIYFVLNHNEENERAESPERCLLAAVLVNAVRDIMPRKLCNGETKKNNRYEAADAYLWFKSNGLDRNGDLEPFSYIWICEQLGIDHELLRANACRIYEQGQIIKEY